MAKKRTYMVHDEKSQYGTCMCDDIETCTFHEVTMTSCSECDAHTCARCHSACAYCLAPHSIPVGLASPTITLDTIEAWYTTGAQNA